MDRDDRHSRCGRGDRDRVVVKPGVGPLGCLVPSVPPAPPSGPPRPTTNCGTKYAHHGFELRVGPQCWWLATSRADPARAGPARGDRLRDWRAQRGIPRGGRAPHRRLVLPCNGPRRPRRRRSAQPRGSAQGQNQCELTSPPGAACRARADRHDRCHSRPLQQAGRCLIGPRSPPKFHGEQDILRGGHALYLDCCIDSPRRIKPGGFRGWP